jgi:hypothetical protein
VRNFKHILNEEVFSINILKTLTHLVSKFVDKAADVVVPGFRPVKIKFVEMGP